MEHGSGQPFGGCLHRLGGRRGHEKFESDKRMESLHPYEVSACKCMLRMMGLGGGGLWCQGMGVAWMAACAIKAQGPHAPGDVGR